MKRREFITLLGGAAAARPAIGPRAAAGRDAADRRADGVCRERSRITALRCCSTLPLMASKHTGIRRRPTPEITCSVLDSIAGARDVATHNDILRCNMGCFRCVIPARFLPVFGRFEANSKVFLHRRERRRLALA
jgi:hypothetical protein